VDYPAIASGANGANGARFKVIDPIGAVLPILLNSRGMNLGGPTTPLIGIERETLQALRLLAGKGGSASGGDYSARIVIKIFRLNEAKLSGEPVNVHTRLEHPAGRRPGHIEVRAIALSQGGSMPLSAFYIAKNRARLGGIELQKLKVACGFLPVDLLQR
jgi:hypothetical protein